MEEYTTALESNMATLTIGRLPPQLFPPAHLKQLLNEVIKKLTPGWSFSTYVTEAMPSGTHVHIPTYELVTQFQFFEVLNLSEASNDGIHQVQYAGLPILGCVRRR